MADQKEPCRPKRDRQMMREAVVFISQQLSELREKEGVVIFPQELGSRDRHSLRGHRSGIGNRLGFMVPVPYEGGSGTVIEIRARRR